MRVRLGVFPVAGGSSGGGYQYSLTVLDALGRLMPPEERVALVSSSATALGERLVDQGWDVRVLRSTLWRRVARRTMERTLGSSRSDRLRARVRAREGRHDATGYPRPSERALRFVRGLGLDLLFELDYTGYGLELTMPFILPIHDLQHRINPRFPEVGNPSEWSRREAFLTRAIPQAAAILVDSDIGKDDVIEHYGRLAEADRIHVLPFVPASYLASATPEQRRVTRSRYSTPSEYLLFPAQFWPHKNHLRVVQALETMSQADGDIHVVMTGGAGDTITAQTLDAVRTAIDRASLSSRVHILGHVPDEDMAALYQSARGVILPTFFGPTNIPVLEAWSFGVPVLTSDIRGIREQCGSAAILVDPTSVDAISAGIASLWSDEEERSRLVKAGYERLAMWRPEDFVARLGAIVDEVSKRSVKDPLRAARPPAT